MNPIKPLLVGAALLATALPVAPALAQNRTIGYQGILEADGEPFQGGEVPILFGIFNAETAGSLLATASANVNVDPTTGLFHTELNFIQVAGAAPAFGDGERWLVMNVDGQTLSPRAKFTPPPVAQDLLPSAKAWQVYGSGNAGFLPSGYAAIGNVTIHKNGRIGIGTTAPLMELDVRGQMRTEVLHIIGGSDIAEPFDVAGAGAKPEPGMVVCIDPDRVGELRVSDRAFDSRVAGIISGAGGVRPGMTLSQPGTDADGEHPVALTGRVWCFVDADANGPVVAGDLLTTSDTPGHAMRAGDDTRANGAVIGKAMSSLDEGRGLVLVLVNLQ